MIFRFEQAARQRSAPDGALLFCSARTQRPHQLQYPFVNLAFRRNARFVIRRLLRIGWRVDFSPGFSAINRAMHLDAEMAMAQRGVKRPVTVGSGEGFWSRVVHDHGTIVAEKADVLDRPTGRLAANSEDALARR